LIFVFEKETDWKDTEEGKTWRRHEFSAENEDTICVTDWRHCRLRWDVERNLLI